MADPRNIAHDKKVMDEKKHDGEDLSEGVTVAPQPGRKTATEKNEDDEQESTES